MQGSVYLLAGGGGNTVVQAGPSGALVVDSKTARHADRILADVKTLVPSAHTDGDSIVFFRKSDVIATGDVFRTDGYPVIDVERGGSVGGVIDALNRVLDLAVPAHHEEGGTMVIPGHGRIADEFDVLEYRDMVTIIRDRVQALVGKGMTLEQVKAARVTLDYDARYGSVSGSWTTDRFVEAVYRSLRPSGRAPETLGERSPSAR